MQFKLKSGLVINLRNKMPMKVFKSMDLKVLNIKTIKQLSSQKGDDIDLEKVMPMIDWLSNLFNKLGWNTDDDDVGVGDVFEFIQDERFTQWFEGLFGILKT